MLTVECGAADKQRFVLALHTVFQRCQKQWCFSRYNIIIKSSMYSIDV